MANLKLIIREFLLGMKVALDKGDLKQFMIIKDGFSQEIKILKKNLGIDEYAIVPPEIARDRMANLFSFKDAFKTGTISKEGVMKNKQAEEELVKLIQDAIRWINKQKI